MQKILLLDVDGVLLQARERYFSDIFEEEQELPTGMMKPFFQSVYNDCILGKKNLEEAVLPYFLEWKWQGTVETFLQHWFCREDKIDDEVFSLVKSIRRNGIKVYLASDHSAYRKRDLLERIGLKDIVDGAFFSCDLGVTKEDPLFFEKIVTQLAVQKEELLFIDDEEENVRVARLVGIKACLFTNVEALKEKIKK